MKTYYSLGVLVLVVAGTAYFYFNNENLNSLQTEANAVMEKAKEIPVPPNMVGTDNGTSTETINKNTSKEQTQITAKSDADYLTKEKLLELAGPVKTNVLLGDYKYSTTKPAVGVIYLCNGRKDNPGSSINGPWITGNTWDTTKKVSVVGSIAWAKAYFTNKISGVYRVLTGNGLPINHNTGIFPVSRDTEAGKYDPNPNTITEQKLSDNLPANPVYSDTPNCMGGEVGMMLTGVPLYNGFDAGLRDAQAHELQDSCGGHPQGDGQYHYHGMSNCFKDISVDTVLGFALDGFPITGPKVSDNEYLQTEDLDACHGIKSEIILDGKKTITYHYVLTTDFPYSVSCFRGKPTRTGPSNPPTKNMQQGNTQQNQTGEQRTPPQEAFTACNNKTNENICSVQTPNGTMNGTSRIPPNQTKLACVPN